MCWRMWRNLLCVVYHTFSILFLLRPRFQPPELSTYLPTYLRFPYPPALSRSSSSLHPLFLSLLPFSPVVTTHPIVGLITLAKLSALSVDHATGLVAML